MNKLIARVTDPDEREKGFTLIELLVVIIIIGVLAAIAIPIFLNQKKKATDATVRSDVRNAVSVIESALADNPPPTITGTSATTGASIVIGSDMVTVSNGNKLKVTGSGTAGYCVVGTNANGSTKTYWFASDTGKTVGGTQPSTGVCSGAGNVAP